MAICWAMLLFMKGMTFLKTSPLGFSATFRLIWEFGDALRFELLPYHFTSPSCRETLLSNMAKLKPTF